MCKRAIHAARLVLLRMLPSELVLKRTSMRAYTGGKVWGQAHNMGCIPNKQVSRQTRGALVTLTERMLFAAVGSSRTVDDADLAAHIAAWSRGMR